MNENQSFTSGLLTGTGAETVYDTTATINFSIDGVMYQKAAVTDGATPTTDGNTSAAFTAVGADEIGVFVWGLNASGTVSLYQGDINDVDSETDLADVYPQFPTLPNGIAPFAYTIIQTTGAASAFTIGTSNWNATGVTATHKNINKIPSRPVTA